MKIAYGNNTITISSYVILDSSSRELDTAKTQMSNCKHSIILNEDVLYPEKIYTLIVENGYPTFGIMLILGDETLLPNILLIPEMSLIIIGYSNFVQFINVHENMVLSKLDIDTPFFQFRYFEKDKQIIVMYETGVVNCDFSGHITWRYNADDVITGWHFFDENIKIDRMDSPTVILSLKNGAIIQECACPIN